MSRSVYLVRHTTPNIKQGVCYGQLDVDVAASFKQEVTLVLDAITKPVGVVYSSPLVRCQKMAQRIAEYSKASLVIDGRIKEIDFGDWENRAWDDIDRDEIDQWAKNLVDCAPYNGESVRQLSARVIDFWQAELSANIATHDACVVVTHAGVLKVLLSYLEHVPLNQCHVYQIKYAQVIELSV